jgi:hypothetical protein
MSKLMRDKFVEEYDRLCKLSCKKNEAYGDSVFYPLGIFNKLGAREAICARIDDKLARIKQRGVDDLTEDTVDDLIGYLVALNITRGLKNGRVEQES